MARLLKNNPRLLKINPRVLEIKARVLCNKWYLPDNITKKSRSVERLFLFVIISGLVLQLSSACR
jgi:hypothetical protein